MNNRACEKQPNILVVAACEGMISLFEKHQDGHVALLANVESNVFSKMEEFHNILIAADENQSLGKLIIVGAKGDIAWMHAALPSAIAIHVAAEIEYPLISGWFKQPSHLAYELEQVLSA